MEKCLEDLKKYFAPDLELHTSQFLVPFRETITAACLPDSFVPVDSLAFAHSQLDRELKRLHLIYEPERDNCVRPLTAEEKPLFFGAPGQSASFNINPAASSAATTANGFGGGGGSRSDELPTDPARDLPLGMLQLPHSKTKTRVFIRVTAHPIPPKLLAWLETRANVYVDQLLRLQKHKVRFPMILLSIRFVCSI